MLQTTVLVFYIYFLGISLIYDLFILIILTGFITADRRAK